MFDTADEIELLALVASGDETAFGQLYHKYYPLLRTHIYRLTESLATADEVIQDVFLKIWNTREALEGIENFKAYLFVVSKNYALSYLRKHVRETIAHQKWQKEEGAVSVESETSSTDYYGLLDAAIDNLPPQQKTAYLLSRHQRLTYAEVAEDMSLSKETVKSYLQLATASIAAYVKSNKTFMIAAALLLLPFLF